MMKNTKTETSERRRKAAEKAWKTIRATAAYVSVPPQRLTLGKPFARSARTNAKARPLAAPPSWRKSPTDEARRKTETETTARRHQLV